MPYDPLRAVILDNDETTGSYTLVFAFLITLECFRDVSNEYLTKLFTRLAKWMYVHHCFRPGLRPLLEVIHTLRKTNKIDAVIMYTNQTETTPPSSAPKTEYPPFLYSPPQTIAFMLSTLVNEPLFDHILARPVPTGDSMHLYKNFNRVLALYPERPKDIRDMIFVDDLARPDFVLANSIESQRKDPSCWHAVDPYIRNLNEEEVRHCLQYCFQDAKTVDMLFPPIMMHCMAIQDARKEQTSLPNAMPFINLCSVLQQKYGYAEKKKSHNLKRKSEKKQPLCNGTRKEGQATEAAEDSRGAVEGEPRNYDESERLGDCTDGPGL